ncbi:restriction endonuclease subunit S [Lactobacillus delbrueckii subsp. lactis]|nr:restriction endonuclease subunit S [Lactobacillus delbrueckii subsp. lactis]MCD5556142.1 restriction endonuclease subunit S [Lactobacillus delbrueckii subsp. lactis]MCD5582564.1 restriction endonuclease subunit S [Lactobacillus delbrueckii subsp. lactis]MCD5584507.1 restriction endonuclease subunit S [Lactobacillus delbrueckii subsp. lactis]MCD5588268.1 restriction endonuclease subunit S [Lactobacillus delbrueckii subsp. lactis]
MAKITMGQSPNSKNYTDNPKDHILVQGNADMKDGQVHPRIWTTEITKIADKGDLILSVRAPVGDIGKTSYDVVIGRGVAAIKGNEFIFQLLKRMKTVGYWTKYSTGSTFESINSLEINNAVINLPKEHEQNKVGKILSYMDHAITLHEEKKRQLERLKSALLKKMFADKSGYPAVRFEGFGGKWDQCKLGNVGTFRGGFGFPENEQGNIDGIAFYKVSDMNDSCNTLTMRKASNYVTSSQISKNKWKPILNQNIIFAKVGAAVYLERKRKAMGPFLLDNNMMAFQPKDADIDYIYYVFQRLRISKHAQVGTLPSLNASELRNITIYIPSLNEQKAVADLMVSLDHTIILYDFKLELLKKLKSSLLQHMFI